MKDDYEEDRLLVKHIRIIAVLCLLATVYLIVGGIDSIPVIG